ncbi:MAG: response regulator, partial [Planctomycetes bacterium]|nr:response regulator [Planctomycetota bacterium]
LAAGDTGDSKATAPAAAPATPAPRADLDPTPPFAPSTARVESVSPSTLSAHDLIRDMRTPLTSMLATAGLMSADPGSRELQIVSLQNYGRQLTSMLADIDDFERLLRGSVDLAADTYDFPQLVRNCAADVAATIADRNIEVRVDVIAGVPRWVLGDPSRVRQLLTRLLENSAWQCTLGPLEVTVHADENTMGVVVQNRTQTATADDGSFGMLFSRQLALTLGGGLVVTAREGGGVEYRLSLPKQLAPDWEIDLLEDDDERTAETAPRAALPRVHGKVLLVDDSADHQRLIGHLLTNAGADVTTASSGSVALHMLESMPFDLVLLDMQMPDKAGYATVAELRQRGDTTPVLAITADTGRADIERALAAGCNAHLAKPIDNDLLVHTLAMHLPVARD